MDFVKVGNSAAGLPELLNEKLKISDTHLSHSNFSAKRTKDGILKNQLASIFNGKCDTNKNDIESTKLAFEEFLKQKKDNSTKSDHILNKNVRSFIKIKKDIYENGNNSSDKAKVCDGIFKSSAISNSTSAKSEKTSDESRMREIRRNGHKPYPTARSLHTKCGNIEESSAGTCQHGAGAGAGPGTGNEQADGIEQKKCDCTYCEVFGTVHKNELLRDRLRVRLHQRREKRCKENVTKTTSSSNSVKIKNVISKVETRVPLPSSPTNIPSTPSISSDSSVATTELTDDIRGLVKYIEGDTALDKAERAQKKAAKKARQRERRERERAQAEQEAQRRLLEAQRREEERRREQERQAEQRQREEAAVKKKMKKGRQAARRAAEQAAARGLVLEETIPAMVTIKRVADKDTPNVTITLKGYTPDQDRLLYTLVEEPKREIQADAALLCDDTKKGKKKKKQLQKMTEEPPKIVRKEVKVTLAVDKAAQAPAAAAGLPSNSDSKPDRKSKREKPATVGEELSTFGNLKLPPGITITKIEGPVNNRNYVASEPAKNNPLVGKSGVIVVDTEKLIHKNAGDSGAAVAAGAAAAPPARSKNRKSKNKKKGKKAESGNDKPKMVTLKNPIFQQMNSKSPVADNSDNCGPAAIFTSENGMVTIRSSRLQQSLSQSGSLPLGMPLMLGGPGAYLAGSAEAGAGALPPNKLASALDAQQILSGLPGIEITKIGKGGEAEAGVGGGGGPPPAQVSIVAARAQPEADPARDDWLYDSVFKPRDVLEDDMDADELELEAFKRFCQQSVPPKHKEKVAHLNVADIVLKKKADI